MCGLSRNSPAKRDDHSEGLARGSLAAGLLVVVEWEAELLEEGFRLRPGFALRLPQIHRDLGPRQFVPRGFGLLPGLGLLPARLGNCHPCGRGVNGRRLVPPAFFRRRPREASEFRSRGMRGCKRGICHTGPWDQIGVWEEEVCGRSWRGRGAYSYPLPQEFGIFPCAWGRGWGERCSFRDSQPEDVSGQVLKSQLAVHLHLRIRARLRIPPERAFDWGWTDDEQSVSAARASIGSERPHLWGTGVGGEGGTWTPAARA